MRKSVAKRIRLIKECRLYSTKELAKELGVHLNTIRQWQKQGLRAVDSICKPFIFRGLDAKSFLSRRSASRKRKLMDGEFYCLRCRRPMKSQVKDISVSILGQGVNVHIRGKCHDCRTSLNRFMSSTRYESSAFKRIGTIADDRINENHCPTVNADISEENNHE